MSSRISQRSTKVSSLSTSEFNYSLAVVIGINQYANGIPTLQTATNDAKALAELLTSVHGYDVQLLVDEAATKQRLLQLLKHDLPHQLTPEDRVLFYFAGHGVALNGEDGPAGYLIPQDAKLEQNDSFLPMQVLHDALIALPCRHSLIILDCCFSGAFRWSSTRDVSTQPEIMYKERYERFIQDPAWQVITSSSYDQEAWDISPLQDHRGQGQTNQHSPFAEALFDALNGAADCFPLASDGQPMGDGVITATELYLYLRNRIEPVTDAIERRQTPGLWPLKKHEKGEYIFLVPGHELNLPPAPDLSKQNNPYRGLESFEEEHTQLFFGRQQLISKLFDFMFSHPLTVVLGASGTGKSSLVKAGLIPHIRSLSHQQWHILPVVRPGKSPLRSLAEACISLLDIFVRPGYESTPKTERLRESSIEKLQHTFKTSANQLAAIISTWKQRNPNETLLIVIDQFEELITVCSDSQERDQFLKLLEALFDQPSAHFRLLITLRSDFESQLLIPALNLNWLNSRFVVPPMTQDELREVIERPAQERVMHFAPYSLVDQLINEVVQMPGALPLLSFTLSELYLKYIERRGDDRALTQADYDAIGGVVSSLTQRADKEYDALVSQDKTYENTIRNVMLRMITIRGGEPSRRRVPLRELNYPTPENKKAHKVIQRFVQARLLVQGQEGGDKNQTYIEPAHDALVHSWSKLQIWKANNQETLSLQQLLTPTAAAWDQNKTQKAGLLWNANPRLNVLSQLLKSSDSWLNQIETQFIQQSIRKRRLNGGIRGTVITVLSILLPLLSVKISQNFREQISGQTGDAINYLYQHKPLEALEKATEAAQGLESLDRTSLKPLHSMIQSVIHKPVWAGDQLRVATTLNQILAQIHEKTSLEAHSARINDVIFSPVCENGTPLIASASQDNTVKLWSYEGKETLEPLQHTDEVRSVDFSSNCQLVVSGSWDGDNSKVTIWSTESGLEAEQWSLQGLIADIGFSPDGTRVITVSIMPDGSGQVQFWRTDGASLSQSFKIDRAHTFSRLDFSADGRTAAIGGTDFIYLWNFDTQQLTTIEQPNQLIRSVQFHPYEAILASANDKGSIKFWDLEGHLLAEKVDAHNSIENGLNFSAAVNDLSFSPDGKKLVSVGDDQAAIHWQFDLISNRELTETSIKLDKINVLKGHQDIVSAISFSPEGKLAATAGHDAKLKIWDLDPIAEKAAIKIWKEPTIRTFFNPDAKKMILLQDNFNAKLWEPQNPISNEPMSLDFLVREPNEAFGEMSISPDGTTLAVARPKSEAETGEAAVELWDINSRKLAHSFKISEAYVIAIKFSPDGKSLAVATDDDKIHLWNRQGELQASVDGYIRTERTLEFSPDGKFLAFLLSSDKPEIIQLWEINHSTTVPLKGHDGRITSIRFSPDAQRIVSASQDQTVKLWTLKGDNFRTFTGHSSQVQDAIFHPNTQILASFSEITNEQTNLKGEIKFWNIQGEEISTFPLFETLDYLGMYFAPEGNALVSAFHFYQNGSPESTLMQWSLDRTHLLDIGCQWLNEPLSVNSSLFEGNVEQTCN